MAKEQIGTSGEINGKKWGITGAVLLILIALIAGIGIYNKPANRLSRQLDLGNRYLEEQDYEQAVIAFNKAIDIDPMCVEAYLGLADAYIGMGDLQAIAADAAQDEEREDITLSINMADVKIMGYDLMESHFYDLIDAFGVTLETFYLVEGDASFGVGADEFIGSTQYGFMEAFDYKGDR